MKIFSPSSLNEALRILSEEKNVLILAGGTDLVVKYKEKVLKRNAFCNIGKIKELSFIKEADEHICIGASTTHDEIAQSLLIKKYLPLLVASCSSVGSPQIRNRGTIGGNIVTASPAGDTIPSLVVADAKLKAVSSTGERIIAVRSFFTGPGKTILKSDEIITEIIVPKLKSTEHSFYTKLGKRQALAISVVGVAAKAEINDDVFQKVEVALGSVSPTVIYKRIEALEGKKWSKEVLWDELQKIKQIVNPISDERASAEYRREMVAALLFQGLVNLKKEV